MIVLKVGGRDFKYFTNVNVDLGIDTIASTFNFSGFFDISDNELKKIFKPFSYRSCEVWFIDEENRINERLITGTLLNPALSIQREIRLTGISGYSKTGIFEDVNVPTKLYPLQFDGLSLKQIAQKLCDEFGITLRVFENAEKDANKVLELAKADPGQTIKDFLSKIARDRNITITHDNLGRLLLYKILNQTPPKIKINENDRGVITISFTPNGQALHSDITVIKQASTDNQNEGQITVISPFISGIKRPKVMMLENGSNTDVEKAATAAICSEAKNFQITIELEGWTYQNKIMRSGFYIQLTAPSIFLETTKLVLQRVNFKSDPKKGKTLTLTAVLPCVYTGELPSKNPFI